jgi:hypothetical protein
MYLLAYRKFYQLNWRRTINGNRQCIGPSKGLPGIFSPDDVVHETEDLNMEEYCDGKR